MNPTVRICTRSRPRRLRRRGAGDIVAGVPYRQPLPPAGQPGPNGRPVLAVTAARRGAACVLQLRGEVDASTADQIPAAVSVALAAWPGGPQAVIADLSGVTFFSAAGIAALTRARARCAGTADFRVAAPSPKVLRVLTLTGDLEKFPLYPTVDQALDPDPDPPGAGDSAPQG